MKKLLIIFAFVASLSAFNTASAQLELGGGLSFGTGGGFSNVGLNARGYYGFGNLFGPGDLRVGPGFSFFFPKTSSVTVFGSTSKVTTTLLSIDIDGNYVMHASDQFKYFGVVGFQVGIATVKSSSSGPFGGVTSSGTSSNVGVNLGAGIQYNIGGLDILGELKYESGLDIVALTAGIILTLD